MQSMIGKPGAVLLLMLLSIGVYAQKKVCITVDDLPTVGYGMNSVAEWEMITDRILATCLEKGIPAIGYVNEGKLYVNDQLDSGRLFLLEKWLQKGFELGNHTFSHPDYHKTAFTDYVKDIAKGQRHIPGLAKAYDQQIKYFRHPYLRAGNTEASTKALENFLDKIHLVASPVTLDSDDYLFAQRYSRAVRKGDSTQMQSLGAAYVKHTERKLKFYERLSTAIFGRNIDHTYLMHASLLNADYLDELADMFSKNGYEFISQSEVLKDPAYAEPVTKFGNWGMSWLYRWALSTDKGKELFKEDVELPEIVRNQP